MIDHTEHQTRERLAEYGFPADDFPAVRGNLPTVARGEDADARRCLEELRSVLDLLLPLPRRDEHGPFLLSIDDVRQNRTRPSSADGWNAAEWRTGTSWRSGVAGKDSTAYK
jgi:translation elongation factor EF-Tu-like GTPase